MVVVTYKIILTELLISWMPIGQGIGIIYSILNKDFNGWFFLVVILFPFSMGVMLSMVPNFKIIFDDYGMTVKHEMNVLFFTVLKQTIVTPWSAITFVDWWGVRAGYVFAYERNGRTYFQKLNFGLKNRKEALEYAIKNLPMSKFTEDVQKKLRKIGCG